MKGAPGHDVDGVSTADAHRDHAQAAGVGGVAVGADHHAAREGVILEDDLVDDPRAGLPESDAVAGAHRTEEVVDLHVGVHRSTQVHRGVDPGSDEVVAVDGRGDHHIVEPRRHELEGHDLGQGILEGDPVRVDVHIGAAPFGLGASLGPSVSDQHLLGQGERPVELGAPHRDALAQTCVDPGEKCRRRGGSLTGYLVGLALVATHLPPP